MNSCRRIILVLAQGFGAGLIRWMPGTFGSLVGFVWTFILLLPASFLLFATALVLGIVGCVPICTRAEKLLNKIDPASVVLDEIVAIPLCFLYWIWGYLERHERMPNMEFFLSARALPATVGIFLLFRLFDIWKPWPVNRVQDLPAGLGITADDVMAAIYVNLVVIALAASGWWPL